MNSIEPIHTDFVSLVTLLRGSTTIKSRKAMMILGFIALLSAVGGAGAFLSMMNVPTKVSPKIDRRESFIEQLAVARIEQQEFALQVEATRAQLAYLRLAQGPTELETVRSRAADSAWLIVRQSKSLVSRQKKLSRDADQVFSDWRKEIKTVKNPSDRLALVTHYKQVHRHLKISMKHQSELLKAADNSSLALSKIALELEDATLSELMVSRQTMPEIDSGLKIAAKTVWQSISAMDQFRKSAQTIASLGQPR